jgi:hypothetical protein
LIGAQIANMRLGENQHTGGSANLQTRVSSAKAAEIMNVSERQLNTGRMVIANVPENITELVKRGELSLHQAAAVAMARNEDKARIASLPEQEVKKEAKRLTKSATGTNGSRKRNEEPSPSGSLNSEIVAGTGYCSTCGAPTNWRELIADGACIAERPFGEAA